MEKLNNYMFYLFILENLFIAFHNPTTSKEMITNLIRSTVG